MISQDNFNQIVSKNLALYRKLNGLTQLDLAEKLNYSDKAISKWERGESLPDIYVLYNICEIYGITIDDLLSEKVKPTKSKKIGRRFFIPLLSCCLVWLVATVLFVLIKSIFPFYHRSWLSFIVAIPVTFIVLTVFTSIYRSYIGQFISISALVWTTILSLHLCLTEFFSQISLYYFIGIPLQVGVLLWYGLKWYNLKKSNKNK